MSDHGAPLYPAHEQPLSHRPERHRQAFFAGLEISCRLPIYHPLGWSRDGPMAYKASLRAADSEKVTINLGYVDLGHIDLLVREGFYSNRTDMIRTAIRNQLGRHAEAVQQTIVRQTLEIGLRHFSREDLERV